MIIGHAFCFQSFFNLLQSGKRETTGTSQPNQNNYNFLPTHTGQTTGAFYRKHNKINFQPAPTGPTTGGFHPNPDGVGAHIDHHAGNTQLHGSLDAHLNTRSLSASGSVSQQHGAFTLQGNLHGRTDGNRGVSVGAVHTSENGAFVYGSAGINVDPRGKLNQHAAVGFKKEF